MDPVNSAGITSTASTKTSPAGAGTASKSPRKTKTPTPQDQAVLTGQDTKGNVKAASTSGALQGTRKAKTKTASASDSEQDVKDFQDIGSVLGTGQTDAPPAQQQTAGATQTAAMPQAGPAKGAEEGAASQATPEAQGAAQDTADMIIGASALLAKQGIKVTPQQLAQAFQTAQQNGSQNPIQDAAKALNIDPGALGTALGQSENMVQMDMQTRHLAAILSQKLGKNITPQQIAQAYAKAAHDMQSGGGNMFAPNSGMNITQLAAQNLGVDSGDLADAVNQIGQNQGAAGAAGGGGAQPPGGGGAPPAGGGAQPPGGGAQPPGVQPQAMAGGPGSIINSDYLQNLQKMMGGLGINIPPQIMQSQQQMMNQLYGYGLMQQAVQTQRAGLEQYMQVMNTVLQMNLSVMQNQNLMLNMVVQARQQMYQMNQQMVQSMFTKTMQAGEGWIKAFGGGE